MTESQLCLPQGRSGITASEDREFCGVGLASGTPLSWEPVWLSLAICLCSSLGPGSASHNFPVWGGEGPQQPQASVPVNGRRLLPQHSCGRCGGSSLGLTPRVQTQAGGMVFLTDRLVSSLQSHRRGQPYHASQTEPEEACFLQRTLGALTKESRGHGLGR